MEAQGLSISTQTSYSTPHGLVSFRLSVSSNLSGSKRLSFSGSSGNHESNGKWSMAGLLDNMSDIQVVAEYMKQNYGYDVAMVVGHSKASIVACKWICSGTEETSKLEMFVNVSGRYRMEASLLLCHCFQPSLTENLQFYQGARYATYHHLSDD